LPRVRSGIDIVQISRIDDSLKAFGGRFSRRLFTVRERADSDRRSALAPQRYAVRFAAKEAALKAFDLAHAGINWRDIEVVQGEGAACSLQLHGKAARLVDPLASSDIFLSLSNDGDYAVAVVVAMHEPTAPPYTNPT
jgi:holo-[acyl-carrier protein] synthase